MLHVPLGGLAEPFCIKRLGWEGLRVVKNACYAHLGMCVKDQLSRHEETILLVYEDQECAVLPAQLFEHMLAQAAGIACGVIGIVRVEESLAYIGVPRLIVQHDIQGDYRPWRCP